MSDFKAKKHQIRFRKGKQEGEGKGGEGLQPPKFNSWRATADLDPHFANHGSATVTHLAVPINCLPLFAYLSFNFMAL